MAISLQIYILQVIPLCYNVTIRSDDYTVIQKLQRLANPPKFFRTGVYTFNYVYNHTQYTKQDI